MCVVDWEFFCLFVYLFVTMCNQTVDNINKWASWGKQELGIGCIELILSGILFFIHVQHCVCVCVCVLFSVVLFRGYILWIVPTDISFITAKCIRHNYSYIYWFACISFSSSFSIGCGSCFINSIFFAAWLVYYKHCFASDCLLFHQQRTKQNMNYTKIITKNRNEYHEYLSLILMDSVLKFSVNEPNDTLSTNCSCHKS